MDKQYHALRQAQNATERFVKKSWYFAFKWAAVFFALCTIGLVVWVGISYGETLPRQERIIEGHAAFMVNNYAQTVAILANDNPHALPRPAQYILATSFIQLENFTVEQRTAILNHISPSSTENELLYWIFIGRGSLIPHWI